MLKLLKKLKELVFGKTVPAVVETPIIPSTKHVSTKVEACEVKPAIEVPIVEASNIPPKKKFKHKSKPKPKTP